MKTGARFQRRVLLADGNEALLLGCSDALLAQGYEVITARNGFEALNILRGAHPDLLVTELNLPHMSGFELLSVFRKRFPRIWVIATSGEYTAVTVPHEAICDVFVPKSAKFFSELIEEARALISESPDPRLAAKSLCRAGLDTSFSFGLHRPDLPGVSTLFLCF